MSPDPRTYRLTIASSTEMLDVVDNTSEEISREAGCSEEDRYHLSLSVREAVANAIKHGNQFAEDKDVAIRFEVSADRIQIWVRDQGEGFEPGDVPDPTDPAQLLSPSGRGLFYMNHFMDEVSVQPADGGGSEVHMIKYLKGKDSAP